MPNPLRPRAGLSGLLRALLLILCFGGPISRLQGADSGRRTFALAAGTAEMTLEQFSEQAGVQIVFLLGDMHGVTTNPVQGSFAIRDALDRLVARTGLRVEVEGKSGAYVIKRDRIPQSPTSPRTKPPNPPMKTSVTARLTAALAVLATAVSSACDARPATATLLRRPAREDKRRRASGA